MASLFMLLIGIALFVAGASLHHQKKKGGPVLICIGLALWVLAIYPPR